jgi:hypothetical protein
VRSKALCRRLNGRRRGLTRRIRCAPRRLMARYPGVLESDGEAYLPAGPHTVRAFIAAQVKPGKKPRQYSIMWRRSRAFIHPRVHTVAHLRNPCSSEAVRLGLDARPSLLAPCAGSYTARIWLAAPIWCKVVHRRFGEIPHAISQPESDAKTQT